VANTYIFSAWGETVATSESISNRFRWVGEFGYYHDDESDDYYIRARYYDLATGRWMSQDPLYAPFLVRTRWATLRYKRVSLNLYQFSRNQTTRLIDPSGLAFIPAGPIILPGELDELIENLSREDENGEERERGGVLEIPFPVEPVVTWVEGNTPDQPIIPQGLPRPDIILPLLPKPPLGDIPPLRNPLPLSIPRMTEPPRWLEDFQYLR
jgi:RHS repeat-associated protein